MEVHLIRSQRKTLALQVKRDGTVVVRAPRFLPQKTIEAFLASHASWIRQQQETWTQYPVYTKAEEDAYRNMAKEILPAKVRKFSEIMHLKPEGITITSAQTRFGSCSGKNRLSFSWRLMAYPESCIDYVVIHELAHIRYKNHSPAFHDFVRSFCPDAEVRRAQLRQPPQA